MAISEETIRRILSYGVMAPSGENAQPWRFVVRGAVIELYNLPERDQSLYSHGQHASYFAHGALIENLVLATRTMGYATDVTLFPKKEDPTFVAAITLSEGKKSDEPLFYFIPERMTNRKPYRQTTLTPAERQELLAVAASNPNIILSLVEDRAKQNEIGYAASVNEEILFGNPKMHQFFFGHINWTKEEDDKKSIGFYLPTLELPGPAKPLFKLMKRWSVAELFGKLGMPKQIAKGNAKNVYATGAAHGAVAIKDNRPESFIEAGRFMERLWLTVTKLGLNLQPLAGVTFLMQGIMAGDTAAFTEEQVSRIKAAYETMKMALGLTSEEVFVMGFRIGDGDRPSAHATRLPPDVQFE